MIDVADFVRRIARPPFDVHVLCLFGPYAMNSFRYAHPLTALAAALALSGCQTVPTPPVLEVSAVPVVRAGLETAVAPVPVVALAVPAQPVETAAAPSSPAAAADPRTTEPRILRGNDRVIAPAKAVPSIEGAPVSFTFEEAPVSEVVRTIMGDILKTSYVLHPPLSGTVTLATREPIAPDQAVFLLESALQANGLAMVRDARGSYHVGRPEALRGIGGLVRQVGKDPLPPGYGAIVVPLQYIGAAEMATILRPMMPGDALVRVDTVRNLLVLVGTRTQAEGWLDLVNTFDVNLLQGMSVGVFPLKHVSAKEVEAALRLVGGGGGVSGSGAAATGAAASPGGASVAGATQAALGEGNPLFGALRIMPIERFNSILVVTPRAAYLDEARRWIERLDQPSDNGSESQLFIYQVQNVNARHLATVLAGIFGGQPGAGSGNANSGVAPGLSSSSAASFNQSGFAGTYGNAVSPFGTSSLTGSGTGGIGMRAGGLQPGNSSGQAGAVQAPVSANLGSIRVMADDLNNSVLVWSTKAEYNKIESTLKRLDLPPTQVLIEASIVEVTLGDDLEYGLQWAFSDSRSSTDYTGAGALNGIGNTKGAGLLGSAITGFSYALKNPAGNVRAVLNALSKKTSVKVIASPSLMVLDNHSASIAVGTQTPIQAGTTSNIEGTVTTTNIQYKDTGVNLVVTPSVNSGNIVTMQVDQSVTDVGTKDEVSGQRGFLQRQLSSKVAVRSGESIVMGGLIQERSSTTKSGIPVLHTLPVVGNLFGSTAKDGARTELIVIITPRVVRSDIDIREVSEDLRDRMKGLTLIDADRAGTKAVVPGSVPFRAVPQR